MEPDPLAPPPRGRRLALTSLIDVIFLLVLFFMLTSTFSRFAEVELSAASGGGGASAGPVLFLQVGEADLVLNGASLPLDQVRSRLPAEPGTAVVISLRPGVTAQRLTDVLVALRALPGVAVTVIG